MNSSRHLDSRRGFLSRVMAAGASLTLMESLGASGSDSGTGAGASGGTPASATALADDPVAASDKALVAITMDLEMSMHYPKWDDMEWNYMKGCLDEPTKQYTVEACRRIKAKSGLAHCFVLGRTFEQENVDWLKEIVRQGHCVGNHTYDHVTVWARQSQDVQFRFRRAPWLIEGKPVPDVIRDNIRTSEAAMKTRLGIAPNGFRTPGGSGEGLRGRNDLQAMFLELGYRWVSSMARSVTVKPQNPDDADFQAVAQAQKESQPFAYPSGLVEIPMSPLGDVASFRREREKWKIGDFLKMLERCLRWTIENHAVFDLLTHPAIMQWEDPKFQAYNLICDIVGGSGGKAAIVGLDTIARRVQLNLPSP